MISKTAQMKVTASMMRFALGRLNRISLKAYLSASAGASDCGHSRFDGAGHKSAVIDGRQVLMVAKFSLSRKLLFQYHRDFVARTPTEMMRHSRPKVPAMKSLQTSVNSSPL